MIWGAHPYFWKHPYVKRLGGQKWWCHFFSTVCWDIDWQNTSIKRGCEYLNLLALDVPFAPFFSCVTERLLCSCSSHSHWVNCVVKVMGCYVRRFVFAYQSRSHLWSVLVMFHLLSLPTKSSSPRPKASTWNELPTGDWPYWLYERTPGADPKRTQLAL